MKGTNLEKHLGRLKFQLKNSFYRYDVSASSGLAVSGTKRVLAGRISDFCAAQRQTFSPLHEAGEGSSSAEAVPQMQPSHTSYELHAAGATTFGTMFPAGYPQAPGLMSVAQHLNMNGHPGMSNQTPPQYAAQLAPNATWPHAAHGQPVRLPAAQHHAHDAAPQHKREANSILENCCVKREKVRLIGH